MKTIFYFIIAMICFMLVIAMPVPTIHNPNLILILILNIVLTIIGFSCLISGLNNFKW
jgi:hypothetical protein